MLKRREFLRIKRSSEEVQTTGDRSNESWAKTKRAALCAAFGLLDKYCADAVWKHALLSLKTGKNGRNLNLKKKKKKESLTGTLLLVAGADLFSGAIAGVSL